MLDHASIRVPRVNHPVWERQNARVSLDAADGEEREVSCLRRERGAIQPDKTTARVVVGGARLLSEPFEEAAEPDRIAAGRIIGPPPLLRYLSTRGLQREDQQADTVNPDRRVASLWAERNADQGPREV